MSTNPHPILYSFRRCPYAMRARLAIAHAGVNAELREVVLRDKPAELLSVSPKGTVPVLVLPGGDVIDESYDIMKWALRQTEQNEWLKDEAVSDTWVIRNDRDFKPWLDRYKYADRHPDCPRSYYQQQCLQWLSTLNTALEERSGYLQGDQMTLGDAALLPFVRQCAHVDRDWFYATELCGLKTWLDNFLVSALFRQVMPKYTPWRPGNEPIII